MEMYVLHVCISISLSIYIFIYRERDKKSLFSICLFNTEAGLIKRTPPPTCALSRNSLR